MELLSLVSQCTPGDTINLTSMTIVHKSLMSGIKRWLSSENRSHLIDSIENARKEFPIINCKLVTYVDHIEYYYLIDRIINGLLSLGFTYINDEEITLRLRKLIDYFTIIRPPPPPLALKINNLGFFLSSFDDQKKGLHSLL